ncbi:uncharacterized protein K452DRAFT_259565 [Aplosporella prunicola CBS 121167]|uniref:NAD(P)-binding protein n=1 Tax=Aplosporella prunicola CBS 121167 TaxID=1176127 RepID=A0A6A6AW36_9PEZI|nr:uncharacterized protein K452DRAFT_259565 [Aplosporella prunicola CBS 121167]KAF2136159.1 hypothetical protein K452DRAFT_259565 [Aplosporella prunicola CBS 121167]
MSTSITSNPNFGYDTSAEEVAASLAPSIAGKTILVTGVTQGGIGAHFLDVVASHNPKTLILAGRNPKNTATAISNAHVGVETRTVELDLSSQAKVREAAEEVLSWPGPLDVLVNNAGVMAVPHQLTADGIEMHFGTNFLGHFLFTNLLMPKLLQSELGPRVVNVSSDGHQLSDIRWDDLDFKKGEVYEKWRAYGQSKTANILFNTSLVEKLAAKGVKAFTLHPGIIQTNLGRHMRPEDFAALEAFAKETGEKRGEQTTLKFKTIGQGAATHVVAAFDPKLNDHNGVYLFDCQLAAPKELEPYAVDKDSAARLWELAEKLVGQKFSY